MNVTICVVITTKWPGKVISIEDGRSKYRGLVKKPERKRPLRRQNVDGRI